MFVAEFVLRANDCAAVPNILDFEGGGVELPDGGDRVPVPPAQQGAQLEPQNLNIDGLVLIKRAHLAALWALSSVEVAEVRMDEEWTNEDVSERFLSGQDRGQHVVAPVRKINLQVVSA